MRVLLTGGTGYLGRHVAEQLRTAGHRVVVFCRPGGSSRVPAGCEAVEGDLAEVAAVRGALSDCDGIIHMAALVKMWARDRRAFDRMNVEALDSVLRAAEEARTPRIVYTSTIVALGPTDGGVGNEETERVDFAFRTDYERTKWLAETMVRHRQQAGLPVVVVYPGVVYGPGASTQGNLLRKMLGQSAAGRLRTRLGRGDRRICYAFVEDVARGHVLALQRGRPGGRYVLGGENATQDELLALLQELTGRSAPRLRVPYWAAEAVGRALQAIAVLTGRPPEVTVGVVSTFRHEWAYDSSRAEQELGYAITPLRQGLERTLRWLQGAQPT
jgi:NAD+-dependent farnesol dehydrogenase